MALKLLPVFVFMILWLLFPISAEWTSSTNTSCVRKILQSGCNEATFDNSMRCCNSISLETQTSEVCMCSALDNDADFVDGFTMYCSSLLKFIVLLCPEASLLTSPPTTNTSSPVPPAPANSTTPPSSNDNPSPNNTSGKKGNVTITPIVVIVVIVLVVVTIVISIICIRKRKNNDLSEYKVSTLKKATGNFSETNIIGKGGFGIVYKGTLQNGEEIAVKRLSEKSIQGDKEFRAEIERLGELKHDNLVKLRGFCLAKGEKFLLYELVPNKSLHDFLFDTTTYKRPDELWSTRFMIIKGIAKGMVYLHEDAPEKTVHRDLKAANVLLDKKMNPKIADFGLARKLVPDQTHGLTKNPMGTTAYMAPEYLNNPELFSFKTDVYAFGILVLEIISGRKASDVINYHSKEGENLLTDAWRCFDDKKPLALVDPSLKDSFSSEEVIKCIQVGLLCVQESTKRPDMLKVVQIILNIDRPELSVLSKPQSPQLMFLGGPDPSTTSSTQQSATDSSAPISSSAKSDFKNPH